MYDFPNTVKHERDLPKDAIGAVEWVGTKDRIRTSKYHSFTGSEFVMASQFR